MQEKINLMVIDDNQEVLDSFSRYFRDNEVFNIKGLFNNASLGLQAIKAGLEIDILVTDIILDNIDGLELLEDIHRNYHINNIIVMSSLKNDYLLKKVNDCGVSYFVLKPLDFQVLEKRMLECVNNNIDEYDLDMVLSKRISKLLHDLGVPSHIKGYQYIRESISLLYKDPKIKGITKELYPLVAKEYDTTSSRVERAIRHAIEVSWSRGDYDLMEDLFGHSVDYDRAKPTNSEFIATITDKLKLDKEVFI